MSTKLPKNERLSDKRTPLLRISAALGMLAVALGAFGAHALKDKVDALSIATWNTAVLYHLVHAVMLYIIAVGGVLRRASWICMALGVIVFSGSLYVLVLTQLKWLGAITPIGGVLFLVGWGLLIYRPSR